LKRAAKADEVGAVTEVSLLSNYRTFFDSDIRVTMPEDFDNEI